MKKGSTHHFSLEDNTTRTDQLLKNLFEVDEIYEIVFNKFAIERALWLLSSSANTFFCIFSLTVKLKFYDYQNFLTHHDLMLFRQIGRFQNNLKSVEFEESDMLLGNSDEKLIVTAVSYLSRAKVSISYLTLDDFSDFFSEDMISMSMKVQAKNVLHLYKLLLSEKMVKFCLNNDFIKEVASNHVKLFATACERNDILGDLLRAGYNLRLGDMYKYIKKIDNL